MICETSPNPQFFSNTWAKQQHLQACTYQSVFFRKPFGPTVKKMKCPVSDFRIWWISEFTLFLRSLKEVKEMPCTSKESGRGALGSTWPRGWRGEDFWKKRDAPNHLVGFLNHHMGHGVPSWKLRYPPPAGTFESMIFRFSHGWDMLHPGTTSIAPGHGWLEDACCLLGNPLLRGGFRWFQGGYSSLEGIILHEIWCDVVRSLGWQAGPSAISQIFWNQRLFEPWNLFREKGREEGRE